MNSLFISRRKTSIRRFVGVFHVLLMLTLLPPVLTNCKQGKSYEPRNSRAVPETGERIPDTPVPVYTAKIEENRLPRSLHSPGTVVCLDRHTLSANVEGIVDELTVLPGQQISEGEVVARIDSSELKLEKKRLELGLHQLQTSLQRARIGVRRARIEAQRKLIELDRLNLVIERAKRNLEQVRRTYTEAKALHTAGGISKKALEESRLELLSAEEQVKDSSHRITAAIILISPGNSGKALSEEEKAQFLEIQTQQAELEVRTVERQLEEQELLLGALQRRIELCSIRSPSDGFITELRTTAGSRLRIGDPVCSLMDPSRLFIRTNIPESALAKVKVGTALKYSRLYGEEVWEGRVLQVFPETDHLSKSVPLLCTPLGGTQELRPGEYVDIEIETGPAEAVLSLPQHTLCPGGSGETGSIFFIKEGRAFEGSLKIVKRRGEILFFRGDFEAGTEVVLNPPGELRNGTPISVISQ